MRKKIVRFFNAYGLRELLMHIKYGRLASESKKTPMLISCIDGRRNTQGLADRFKAIVSIYALSKTQNLSFRCIYTHPFQLKDYLLPNQYNWLPNENELANSIPHIRYKILRKQPTLKRLLKILPTEKQIRIYANVDYLPEINRKFNRNFNWGDLFNELFKPTDELASLVQYHIRAIGERYIACGFRFMSLLGDFKEYDQQNQLTEEQQQRLIERNKNALQELADKHKMPVLVTSDSEKFLTEVQKISSVYTISGKIVHIDCANNEQKEAFLKLFTDFFMLSNAQKVFSIGTSEMYPTEFPLYAAKSNNVPFERILID